MFKALFLVVSAAVLPRALGVCSPGDLAIGVAPLEASSSVCSYWVVFKFYINSDTLSSIIAAKCHSVGQ